MDNRSPIVFKGRILKPRSIQERVLFVALLPAITIGVVLTWYFVTVRYADLEASLIQRGQALTEQFAPAAEYGAFSRNRDELRRLAGSLMRQPDITAVTIFDPDGAILAQTGRPKFTSPAHSLPDTWMGHQDDDSLLFFHAKIGHPSTGKNDLYTHSDDTLPSPSPTPILGSVIVEVSRANLLSRKREMLAVTLAVTILTLISGALLARRLGRDVTEPILHLQAAVADIRRGRLETRAPIHPSGTLRSLENDINEMATALEAGRELLESRIETATLELRKKKEEAEQASVAKSRFLAAASHDLRQPLHALSLFCAELDYEAHSSAQKRLAQQINTSVIMMQQLMESLLDISRLDIGATTLVKETFPLGPLLAHVAEAHMPTARSKGLRLNCVTTQLWVASDARMLERMIGNLLSNALRYTEHGGVLLGARRAGSHVRIEVWDSGIGIDPEHTKLIFQEFYQINNQERDPSKGLGLGLAIAERMAKRLGHTLRMRSQPGHGSTFSIEVPRALPTAVTNNTIAPDNLRGHVAVATVDDSASENLCALIHSWGCSVTISHSAYHHTSHPDAIIFDAESQDDALNLIEQTTNQGSPPPILILLGEITADLATVLSEHHYLKLAKPVRPAKLRALLQHVLVQEQPLEVMSGAIEAA